MGDKDQDRRNQERERLQREREEKRLEAAKEEEEFQKELEERKKRRAEQRQLREAERQRAEEEHQRLLEELRKKRESDRLIILAGIEKEREKHQASTQLAFASSESRSDRQSPLSLFKSMKSQYQITPPDYFGYLVGQIPEQGEISRFFKNFERDLTKPVSIFDSLPIKYYSKYTSSSDREVLLRLIDAQDKHGYTMLHYTAKSLFPTATEELLKLGANTKIKTFLDNHTPVDKIPPGDEYDVIRELFRKYQGINNTNQMNNFNQKNTALKYRILRDGDSSVFPFLELPIEIQVIILGQISIGTVLTMRCVCRYFNALQISQNHVVKLPEMGKFSFLDPVADSYSQEKQCTLTIIATPTVFHFGMILHHFYQPPANLDECAKALDQLISRIENFARKDRRWKYDLEKLKRFLLNNNDDGARKIYVFPAEMFWRKQSIYLELDHSFGVGIEFTFPGDPPAHYYDDYEYLSSGCVPVRVK